MLFHSLRRAYATPIIFTALAVLTVSCEKFGLSGGSSSAGKVVVRGVAQLGPISEARVTASSSTTGEVVGRTTTDANGTFELTVPNETLVFKVEGGTYLDEATQEQKKNTELLAVSSPSSNESRSLAVTPMSHLVAQRVGAAISAQGTQGLDLGALVNAASREVATMFGISTQVLEALPSDSRAAVDISTDGGESALMIAAISQLFKEQNSGVESLGQDAKDGALSASFESGMRSAFTSFARSAHAANFAGAAAFTVPAFNANPPNLVAAVAPNAPAAAAPAAVVVVPVCTVNGICEAGEDFANCPVDCPAACAVNGTCEPGENFANCPADCAAACDNDTICEAGENFANCPVDCPAACNNNGTCDAGENFGNCPLDCLGACNNDTICNLWENTANCPVDCPLCNHDLVCDPGEDFAGCPLDCPIIGGVSMRTCHSTVVGTVDCRIPDANLPGGQCHPGCNQNNLVVPAVVKFATPLCPMQPTLIPYAAASAFCLCGNGVCDGFGEDHTNCPGDCICNNDTHCDPGENSVNCFADCPPPPCNFNGACDAGETHAGCPADCLCNFNAVCDPLETHATCPGDCAICNGNGNCDVGENHLNCPAECVCNDNGICDAGENVFTCPAECGVGAIISPPPAP